MAPGGGWIKGAREKMGKGGRSVLDNTNTTTKEVGGIFFQL